MDVNNNNNFNNNNNKGFNLGQEEPPKGKKELFLFNYNKYLLWTNSHPPVTSDRRSQFSTVLHPERERRIEQSFSPSVFQLLTMIDIIKRFPISQAFLNPVDPNALGIPDYFEKISEPMDLSTLENELRSAQIDSVEAVRKLDLIWSNAILYNPTSHYVHQDALFLREVCHSQLDLLFILSEIRKNTHEDEDFCGVCGKRHGVEFLCCDGGCHRIFHFECVGGDSAATNDSFICNDCKQGNIWHPSTELLKFRSMVDAFLDLLVLYIDPNDKNYTFLCTAFLLLPDKQHLPQYYQKILDPISLSDILTTKYNNLETFVDDFTLLIRNNKTWYPKNSLFVKDANKYDKLLREKIPIIWKDSNIFKKPKKLGEGEISDVKKRKTEEGVDDYGGRSRRSKGVNYNDKIDEDEFLASDEEDDEMEAEEKENIPKIERMLSHRFRPNPANPAEQITEFYVKWKGKAYIHCSWVKESEILGTPHGKLRLTYYWKDRERTSLPDDDDPFPPEYLEVDRIVAAKQEVNPQTGRPYYLYFIKWKELPYAESTWEQASDFNDDEKIEQYKRNQTRPNTTAPARGRWAQIDNTTIAWKSGNQLRDYQLAGLNWLSFCWYNRRGCILADEMGLGKTVQSITFLASLALENIYGPFLVVAPLSTLGHWQREISEWTSLNCVVYQGNATSREIIRKYEFGYFDGNKDDLRMGKTKFNILLTTYEMLLKPDWIELSGIPWRVIVVDEAQRLKNASSKLLENLKQLKLMHRVLLTGTPLQNRMEELWTLLNFIEPVKFASQEEFLKKFGDMQNAEQVQNLHEVIRPHLLRRMKGDVEKSIPPKEETLIEVELTTVQKQYYKAMLEKNRDFLAKGCNSKNQPHLLNIVMQLRKVCNHPYLIEGVEQKEMEEKGSDDYYENFTKACGKMVLLDKLLPKLKSGGHKVLIFSQMVKCLDLLEMFMSYKGYKFERLDGRIRGNERQGAIDRFCRDPEKFVFLLCTRAGGVGINLAAADTVIIYDSDWNPQNDIQAQARCHRIGQKKEVKVYRLITAKTYEKQMFEMASKKLGLDQAVLHDMGNESTSGPKLDKKEIDQLLKYGAYDLFQQDDEQKFQEENIDQILNRAAKVVWNPDTGENVNASSFSTATFDIGESASKVDMDDPQFWEKVLPQAKTVELLLARLMKKEPFESALATEQWLTELKAFVSEVLDAFGKGKSDSVISTRMSLVELFDYLKSYENNFEPSQWEQINNWQKEISNPRRLRKSISRYASYEDEDSLSGKKKKFDKKKPTSLLNDKSRGKSATSISASSKDESGHPKTPFQWLTKERAAFHNALFAFSIGRWENVKAKSKHPDIELQDLKDYTKEFIKQCIFHAEEAERALFIEWLEPLFSEDEAQDIEINLNSEFTKFIKGKIKGWVRNIKVLNSFEELVTPHLSNLPLLQEKLANTFRPISKWWTKQEDISLLVGAHRYGIADFDQLLDDPELSFHTHKEAIKQAIDKKEEAEKGEGEKKEKDKEKDDDDDDNDDNDDDDTEETNSNAPTKKKSSKSEAAKRQAASESNEWPPRHIIYGHLRWLLENLKRYDEGRRNKSGVGKPNPFKKKTNEWSKREQQDFRTAVACYGICDWDLIKSKANLNKTTEQCEEYWELLKELCSSTLLTSPEERNEMEDDHKLLPISSTMARKILRNVDVLQTVKSRLLSHPKLDEKLNTIDSHDMPTWWHPPLHDKLLLESCLKYGLGGKDWDTWLEDPNNQFYQTEEGKTDYRKQKGKFLLGFVKEKSQLVGRIDYLKNVILEGEEGADDIMQKKKLLGRNEYANVVSTRSTAPTFNYNEDHEGEPRRLQVRNIERDEDGNPILPIFAKGAHIQCLGTVDYTRPTFHAKKYIYTIGYQSTRSLPSCIDPTESVTYYSEIMDGGNHPLFCVWAADNPQKVWKHTTPSGVWQNVLREVRRKPNVSVSGPEMFGFSDLTIKMLIQELPGADKCKNYAPEQFAPNDKAHHYVSNNNNNNNNNNNTSTSLPAKNTRSTARNNNNNNNNNNTMPAYTAISSFPVSVSQPPETLSVNDSKPESTPQSENNNNENDDMEEN